MMKNYLSARPSPLLATASILATLLVTAPAFAQSAQPADPAPQPQKQTGENGDTAASSDQPGLDEIVVTAQKRSENLQKVPIGISAVSDKQLELAGTTQLQDLKVAIPAIQIVAGSNTLIFLRGLGSSGIGPGIENPVALYVDNVYYTATPRGITSLSNIQQVTVLKGPQGTLFGRNATGGVIQIATLEPEGALNGKLKVGYENYNLFSGDAYIGGSIAKGFAADLAVHYAKQGDGWGVNLANGQDVYKLDHEFNVRSKVVFSPTESTKITLIGDYTSYLDSGQPFHVFAGTLPGFAPLPGNPAFTAVPDIGYNSNTNVQNRAYSKDGGVSLAIDQQIGTISFKSITAFRRNVQGFRFDYDGTPSDIQAIDVRLPSKQFTQEVQLTSASQGRFTWLLGGFYMNAQAKYDPFILSRNNLGSDVVVRNQQKTLSLAGFGQATYEIVDGLRFTLGGRYTNEKRTALDGSTTVLVHNTTTVAAVIPAADRTVTFNKFTYRASLDYQASSAVLLYASLNRGFKSGGFNSGQPGSAPFEPEQVDAYEAGFKAEAFDRRVRFNGAFYYYNYSNVQVQRLLSSGQSVVNGGKARIYGVDLDLTARVFDGLVFNAGINIGSPEFTDFPNCATSTAAGGTPAVPGSCAGHLMPYASRTTGNAGLVYTTDLGGGTLELASNLYYNSGFYPESDNVIHQPRYAEVGLSGRYTLTSGLSIGAYVKNLNNKRVIQYETTIPNGTHTGFYSAPRTYGVTLGYKF